MSPELNTELVILSACMNSQAGYDLVSQKITEDDFYFMGSKIIYSAIRKRRELAKPVDGLIISNMIADDPRSNIELFAVGMGYPRDEICLEIEGLSVFHSEHEGYIEQLLDQSITRALLAVRASLTEIAGSGESSALKTDKALDCVQRIASKIEPDQLPSLKAIIRGAIDEFDSRLESRSKIRGLATGFKHIDTALSGLQNGEMYVLAAKSGAGKSTLALNIAHNVSRAHKVQFFSLEMPAEQLVTRMLCAEGNIQLEAVMNGTATSDECTAYSGAARNVVNLNMEIDDRAGVSLEQFASRARIAKTKHGTELIVVDYLQYMNARADSRVNEIAKISNGIKQVAKDLNIPILVLSQMNRENEKRGDKRPIMSDLKESSAIEHDACAVLFIYIPEMYETVTSENRNHVEIIIRKNRHGMTGTHFLYKDFSYGRFNDWGDYAYPETKTPDQSNVQSFRSKYANRKGAS